MADKQYQDYPTGVDNVHTSFSMENRSPEDWPALPELSWAEFLLWMVGRRARHHIEGCSMLPTFKSGDEILYNPEAYKNTSPATGDIVIAQYPLKTDLLIIKRIGQIDGDRYFLLGDNRAESTDSRSFGWMTLNSIVGRVQCLFSSNSNSPSNATSDL